MKKFLSIALLVVLVVSVFVIASSAADTATYWSVSNSCLVKAKVLSDGSVPTYKELSTNAGKVGLLVGIPVDAVVGDSYFQAKDGYTLKYLDDKGNEITSSSAHIGTTDKVAVYKNGTKTAEYDLVTYGDADGDGVFDVIDAAYSARCLTGKMDINDSPAIYEAMKPISADNEAVDELDYQLAVNNSVKNEVEEILKGRKTPIDETLVFESVIYANDGKAKAASVTANDSEFLNEFVTLEYNGASAAPSASGIYSVTAYVSDSEKYLVTPGERELGFIVIAPKNGTGYTTIVDNANKKITIDITKPNDTGADLTGYINGWLNSAYDLAVSSKGVASSTELANAFAFTKYNYYKTTSGKVGITEKTITDTSVTTNAALGCYLPDDYTLWTDNSAQKSVPVTVSDGDKSLSYTISFRQNEAAVKNLEETLLMGSARAAGARGQRSTNPGTYSSTAATKLFVECKRRVIPETAAYENVTRIAIAVPKLSFLEMSMALSISGTGFKTILLGDVDTIGFVSANKKSQFPAISESSMTLLYDTTKENLRFSSYDESTAANSTDIIFDLVDKVLGGMNLGITVSTGTKPSELAGKSGWCRYTCADDVTGLRYTSDYYLEFMKIDATQDTHRSMVVTDVEGCTITTNPSQAQTKPSSGDPYYVRDRMTAGEVFRVTATLAEGYKLSVKDASGKDVYYEAEHDWYIMPNSNVTVTAVKA